MSSITESTVYEDTNIDDHIRSPFQLSKAREKPVKLVSLPQTLTSSTAAPNTNGGATTSELSISSSSLESTEPLSRSSSIGSNPFSLNIKKVSKAGVGPSIPSSLQTPLLTSSTLPTSTVNSSLKDNTQDKVSELQKEVNNLKKEIETKDAKLSSSLKSIKQFWSPELKKERAARKEETEKCLILKEKYQISSSQIEEYKNALEDLESEFQSQEKSIQNLNEKLKNTQEKAKHDANAETDILQSKIKKQDDEIFVLNKTLDDLESKYHTLEEDQAEKNRCISDLEIILVDHEKKILDYEADKKELEVLNNSLHEQEIDYQMLKKKHDDLKITNTELSESALNINELDKLNTYKIADLENELEKQNKLYECCKKDVERFRRSDTEKQERLDQLEDDFLNKDKELEKIQYEVSQFQKKLEDSEEKNCQLQGQFQEGLVSSDVVDQKDREIRNLNIKYEKLDKYLGERENALELCRDELKGVKTAHREIRVEKDQLENQLYEQKSAVDRLEKQKDLFSRSKEHVALVGVHNELRIKYDESTNQLQDLQEKVVEYETRLANKNESVTSLEQQLQEQTASLEQLQNKMEKLRTENVDLTQEFETFKMAATKKVAVDDEPAPKEDKHSKKLWDEMAKKDERIEELEKQLKEKNKQLASLKKNQTTEREKQHQLVNESKKVEVEMQQLEEEKGKRDTRIVMLEDALRESVTIAVEREDLLAGHKEMYETTVNKINELNNEYERVELEKKITNIKNAFLILSLSEKDALIASMEATRKRQMEELFNIKQENLLASISEKDNQIGHLELQSSKTKKQEIKQLKMEKENFVEELKSQNNIRMTVISNGEKTANLLITELKDAPPEQVYEAIRHLSTSTSKLEFYLEEFLSFSRQQYKKELDDLPAIPKKKSKSSDSLKKLSKLELLKELKTVDGDCNQLKNFVHNLLDKLEGVP